ncbi:hypothetical protein TRICI_002004 [Trichomonascus ciferrii]|uniref:Myb-like domain-containing protein n=1 Tax=Trichomonascus ciferrii TaxID=44093 RepID=A0A642V6Y4_9ASCO|nr:hypothetical protein TRICI_002004 [Trichomonascus ciferrii]
MATTAMYSVHSLLNEPGHQHQHKKTKPYEAAAVEDRRKTPSSWDPNDDLVLRHLKEQLKLGWKEIASHFPNRTTNACQFRWRRLMSGTLRTSKDHPSPQHHHPQPQPQLPAAPGNYLSPALTELITKEERRQNQTHNHSQETWSSEEDELLLSRQDLNPEELSLLLPMKSESEIQKRINTLSAQGRWNPKPKPSSVSSPASSSSASSPPPVLHKPPSSFEGLKLPTPVVQRREPSASFTLLNISL